MTLFAHLDAEAWLAKRLEQHRAGIFTGLTDPAIRRERFRAAILEHGLAMVVVGRGKDGKPESYSKIFERLFGTPLEPPLEPAKRKRPADAAAPKTPTAVGRKVSAQPAQLTLGAQP